MWYDVFLYSSTVPNEKKKKKIYHVKWNKRKIDQLNNQAALAKGRRSHSKLGLARTEFRWFTRALKICEEFKLSLVDEWQHDTGVNSGCGQTEGTSFFLCIQATKIESS